MWTAREALESHADSPGGSRELRHSVSPEAPEGPRELSKWFFPASLVSFPASLAPPRLSKRLFPASLVPPGASQAVQLILPCLPGASQSN